MSKNTAARIEVGTSDRGNVFIHEFGNQSETRFEVRCGNLLVITTPDKDRALRVANALADIEEPLPGAKKAK